MTGPDLALTETTQTETVRLFAQGRPAGMPAPAPLGRGSAVGRYVVLDVVGSGGMGMVYAGYDPELDRKIALKLLRPDRLGASSETAERARVRLLREAQAIARLSHPNVVAVHDTGTLGGQVFIAMELVEGRNLRRWLDEERRPWRQVLDVLLLAGRGLAAAHAAGLVHRDFKPENVLLGDDGRVRVVDFGLARVEEGEAGASGAASTTAGPGCLTEGGLAVGTPGYMAPEQFRGEPSDARSDQFGFCVTLYEALYGERPFAGETVQEIAAAAARGAVKDPSAGSRVPAWLRQALLRGLRPDPADRHPSMDDLLAALSRDPAAARRRWLMAAALAVAAGCGLFAWQAGERRSQLCQGAEAKLAGVWDAGRKAAVREAFSATGVPYAREAWAAAEQALDRYAGGWSAMHRDACEATHLRGEQSADLLDRRMFCLDQRLQEVGALAGLFARADAQIVERAVALSSSLTSLDRCADAAALTSRMPPPRDPAQRSRVTAARALVAEVKALGDAGKYEEGLGKAAAAVEAARRAGYRPVEAEALYQLGFIQDNAGDSREAERTMFAALLAAQEGGHQEMAGRAASQLSWITGAQQARPEEGRRWSRMAQAIVEGLQGGDALRSELLRHFAVQLRTEGRYEEAIAVSRRALALAERSLGPDHTLLAPILSNLGAFYNEMGRNEESIQASRRGLKIREATLQPGHPDFGKSFNTLGNAYLDLNRFDEALAHYRRAHQVFKANYGARHPLTAGLLVNMGICAKEMSRYEEALSHYRQALSVFETLNGAEHPYVAMALTNIGEVLTLQKRYAQALPFYRRAIAIDEKAQGPNHPDVAYPLEGRADALAGQRQYGEAVRDLERALAIREGKVDPDLVNNARFALATVLWDGGLDRSRALRLARQARDGYAASGPAEAQATAEIEAWLRQREAVR